jgi:nucleotide-binding universal stress UspA family protein
MNELIKKILVPLDGSESSLRSLKHALDLANQCKAAVIGLHVITNMSVLTAVHAMTLSENKWPNEVRDIMKDAKAIVTDGTPYEGVVIGGEDAGYDIAIFSDSPSNGIDLIVMGRKRSNFLKEAILGSTTNLVLHKSKTPLLVIK